MVLADFVHRGGLGARLGVVVLKLTLLGRSLCKLKIGWWWLNPPSLTAKFFLFLGLCHKHIKLSSRISGDYFVLVVAVHHKLGH